MKSFEGVFLPSLWIAFAVLVNTSSYKKYTTIYPVQRNLTSVWIFNDIEQRNISVQHGDAPYLNCIVNNTIDKIVWVKRKNGTGMILTYRTYTVTDDYRFQALRGPDDRSWSLNIGGVVCDDEGIYDCFVGFSDFKEIFLNTRFELRIVDPENLCPAHSPIQKEFTPFLVVNDFEQNTVTVQGGETAHLNCVVNNTADEKIIWVQTKGAERKTLTFCYNSLTEDNRFQVGHGPNETTWTLKIQNVDSQDEGIYECFVSFNGPGEIFLNTYVDLRIIDDKLAVNQQHYGHSTLSASNRFYIHQWLLWLIILITFIL